MPQGRERDTHKRNPRTRCPHYDHRRRPLAHSLPPRCRRVGGRRRLGTLNALPQRRSLLCAHARVLAPGRAHHRDGRDVRHALDRSAPQRPPPAVVAEHGREDGTPRRRMPEPTEAQVASACSWPCTGTSHRRPGMLERSGVDLAAADTAGRTPLLVACKKGHLGFVEHAHTPPIEPPRHALRRAPRAAFVDAKDENGKTAHAPSSTTRSSRCCSPRAPTPTASTETRCNALMVAACWVIRTSFGSSRRRRATSTTRATESLGARPRVRLQTSRGRLPLLDAGDPEPDHDDVCGGGRLPPLLRRLLAAGGPVDAVVGGHGRRRSCAPRGKVVLAPSSCSSQRARR